MYQISWSTNMRKRAKTSCLIVQLFSLYLYNLLYTKSKEKIDHMECYVNLSPYLENIWLYIYEPGPFGYITSCWKKKMTNTTNAIAVITNRKSKQLIWSLYKHNKWYMSLREAPLSQNGWFFEFLSSLQPIVVIFVFCFISLFILLQVHTALCFYFYFNFDSMSRTPFF